MSQEERLFITLSESSENIPYAGLDLVLISSNSVSAVKRIIFIIF